MPINSFTLYNASAGAGKTYTLVKQYLKIILRAKHPNHFKHLLAITFTNKAVAEMKSRILTTLKEFTTVSSETPPDMLSDLSEELGLTVQELKVKSKKIYTEILKNYAAFDVVTIDTFTHRIIRTFAHDLNLSKSFEVSLNTSEVIEKAVNNLLQKIGTDPKLTQVLVAYALQKTDDDKSWDIGIDLTKVAKVLTSENDAPYVLQLQNKTLEDFEELNKIVFEKLESNQQEIGRLGNQALTLIASNNLSKSDFSGGYLYTHFIKLKNLNLSVSFNTSWQNKLLNNEPLYKKNTPLDVIDNINSVQPQLIELFTQSREIIKEVSFLKNFSKSIIPLSVLKLIQQEIETLKEEENIVLISEFNSLIAREIKDQPAPFIYERIGERYKNYFIDEFQDTSTSQWENLIPLIDNSLSGMSTEPHSLLLVGDAKQSIYRWRGGQPEQFIDLTEEQSPFYLQPQLVQLDTNYRSFSEIIQFNNRFFSYLSQTFNHNTHQELYKLGNQQKTNSQKGGFVQIELIENSAKEEAQEAYQTKVETIILECLERGFEKSDICVLTRKKPEGIAIANHLTEKGIDIISSENLLINNSPEVNLIVSFLETLVYPDRKNVRFNFLSWIYQIIKPVGDQHSFYQNHITNSINNSLDQLGIHFNLQWAQTLSLYELTEAIIRAFKLVKDSNAYVQYFLDEVFTYALNNHDGIIGFLDFWDTNKHKLSLVVSENTNAVSIMTIHKSKGLEFPVVIFPFADIDIYYELEPKVWYPINQPETFNDFTHAYLNFTKDLETYSKTSNEIYSKRRQQLELDNINLLYVALTRAKEQLFILSKNTSNDKGETKEGTYNYFLINYLQEAQLWNDSQTTYCFGTPERISSKKEKTTTHTLPFISEDKSSHNLSVITQKGFLWGSKQESAIEKGNFIHFLLSQIIYSHDIEAVIEEHVLNHKISLQDQKEIITHLEEVTQHVLLKEYFSNKYTSHTEREILTPTGNTLIPDRISTKNNQTAIIDYKTGKPNKSHETQIKTYEQALTQMGHQVEKKILVYLETPIQIKEVI